MRAACLAPIIALVGACGAQEISFESADAGTSGESSPGNGCVRDLDCRLPGLHCDPISGQCVQCVMNGQCTQPDHRICDLALNLCVECGVDGDCFGGSCQATRCVPSCADGGGCTGTSVCSQGVCVGCRSDADCAGARAGPVCDTAVGQCVQCVSNTQCPAYRPRCNPTSGRCVECLTSQNCSSGEACDPVSHSCVDTYGGGFSDGGFYDFVDGAPDDALR